MEESGYFMLVGGDRQVGDIIYEEGKGQKKAT